MKLHLLEHFPLLIKLFGAPKYWDTVLSEARHKAVKVDVRNTTNRDGIYQGEILRKQTSDHVNDLKTKSPRGMLANKTCSTPASTPSRININITHKDVGGHGQTSWNWRRTPMKWIQATKTWTTGRVNSNTKNLAVLQGPPSKRIRVDDKGETNGFYSPYLFPGNG